MRSNRNPRTRTRVHKEKYRAEPTLEEELELLTEASMLEAAENLGRLEEELAVRFGMNKTCRSCDD